MSKDFQIKVLNPDRAKEFQAVFGTDTVAVLSPVQTLCKIEGEERYCWMLDVGELSSDQRYALYIHLSLKFNAGINEVSDYLLDNGLPILAEETTLTVYNPAKWLDGFDITDESLSEGELE